MGQTDYFLKVSHSTECYSLNVNPIKLRNYSFNSALKLDLNYGTQGVFLSRLGLRIGAICLDNLDPIIIIFS